MQIRSTNLPRIEWKEKVDGRWIGRTLSVTPDDLERDGVAASNTDGP